MLKLSTVIGRRTSHDKVVLTNRSSTKAMLLYICLWNCLFYYYLLTHMQTQDDMFDVVLKFSQEVGSNARLTT